jgi:hypothetical protein
MSQLSMEVAVIPALPGEQNGDVLAQVRQRLSAVGVNSVSLAGHLPRLSEYRLAAAAPLRRDMEERTRSLAPIIGRSDGLVVVNNLTETVVDSQSKPICRIPNSVGHLAETLMVMVSDIWGESERRLFLSHEYPDTSGLFVTAAKNRSVTSARTRMLGLYPLSPVVLKGDMLPVVEKIRARRQQS